ncbi:aminopeptidase P family N-terminal domain-containing protein [Geodermatophilus obscurus]|uniref:Xaa-Pro aminopeptidase-like protein n=1 Tax=Geodermatophilus obscurus (strain ATCC 25078 / DSM 43160 / JCM 3152 / CCUG 61914 / KCC A-0152 / KCTC 9177 / NBRC 13315 / NRRL B-3577 / G-20) TaxID=526225 RepID=D2S7M1_GEOOG|nr:aminopeptidase P family N-terminal domain-containing protein [Geodermatophilus obscurus]ADB75480.1 Xaa-Pro aminopeptidase-like protein [Geodermatophilus obscurus DSM 43160]
MTGTPGSSFRQATRPGYDVPRSVASARTREAQPEVDAALVRTHAALHRHDLAAALLVGPVDTRYVSGTSTMPVWTLHVTDRYVLVPAEGEPILWAYASAPLELVSPHPHLETRTATSWSGFGSAERAQDRAERFAAEVADALRERGIHDARIGVERLDGYGFLALQTAGPHLKPVQLAIEQARATKGAAELELIRRSVRVCDAAMTHLHLAFRHRTMSSRPASDGLPSS